MKKVRVVMLSLVLLTLAAVAYAAECREGNLVLNGRTCTVTADGHCSCSD